MKGPSGSGPTSPERVETVAQRRQRLVERIELERILMVDAADRVLEPVRQFDRLKVRAMGQRHWLYPASPVLALLAWRWRPRVSKLPALALRGWSVWRIVKKLSGRGA